MQVLKTITFSYDTREDRIMAAINFGRPEAWSCWLTRRLVLAVLERAPDFIASTSALAQRAPADIRGELVAFERDAAIVKTAKAMTPTPPDVVKTGTATAELGKQLTISSQKNGFRMELYGGHGGGAVATLARAELQRILQMLGGEAAKAGWLGTPAKSPDVSAPEIKSSKPVQH